MGVRALRSSITISLLFHALLVLLCVILFSQRAARTVKRVTLVELEPLPNRRQEKETRHRIVETKKGEKTDVAPDKSFLGFQNQRVDRETVSKNDRVVVGKASGHNKKSSLREKRRARAENKRKNALSAPLARYGLPMIPSAKELAREDDDHNWAEFGASPEDYVPGMKRGDETALNTKQFVFYGYFQRIRERLDQAWVPILRRTLMSFYRQGRQLASDMDHVTKVVVVLNSKGEIIAVKMIGESGTRDLDDAAVKAFNNAGPFPNPPSGIIDAQGTVQIPWDFILRT